MGRFYGHLFLLAVAFFGQLNWAGLVAQEGIEAQTPEVDGVEDMASVRVDHLGVLYGIYVRMGERDKATMILEELRTRDPVRAQKAEALVLSRVPQGDDGEEAEARRLLLENGPEKAIAYLEKLKAEKFVSQRFPYSVVLAEAYLAGGRYQQARKLVDTLVESEATPKFEKGAALELKAELDRIKPVEVVTTSVDLDGDVPSAAMQKSKTASAARARSQSIPVGRGHEEMNPDTLEKLDLSLNRSLKGIVDYQHHPDGDLYGFRFEYSQCLRDCLEAGIRARHHTINLENRSDIRSLSLDREVYDAVVYLRLHRGQGYGEISGGSGSHDLGAVGLTVGRDLKLKNDWGFKFSGEVNQMLEDSIQMMALNATEDHLRLEFNARREGLEFLLRGEARTVDLRGQDIGSGQLAAWSLSQLIWEKEDSQAEMRVSYLGTYSRFDGESIPASLQSSLGMTGIGGVDGNEFFLQNINQQGLAWSYRQSCGTGLQFTGSVGALRDFEDEEVDFFALVGAHCFSCESLTVGFDAGYYSDGSFFTQDDGSHLRLQTLLQKRF